MSNSVGSWVAAFTGCKVVEVWCFTNVDHKLICWKTFFLFKQKYTLPETNSESAVNLWKNDGRLEVGRLFPLDFPFWVSAATCLFLGRVHTPLNDGLHNETKFGADLFFKRGSIFSFHVCFQEGTPQKSNIDTKHCHFLRELPFPNHHFGYCIHVCFQEGMFIICCVCFPLDTTKHSRGLSQKNNYTKVSIQCKSKGSLGIWHRSNSD